jgi:Rv0078B-related antitoxin
LVHDCSVITPDSEATPAQRFAIVLELHEFAVEQMRANLRRRMPGASSEELEEALAEWSMHRPGAEHGDGPSV